ncbi:hypothetical protein RvY_17825-2 [Ramazzottius varieornatus]|uniref:Uncharacterized protein n=1 Tax=Ramazzottius varieornatus TaxID=947166 RepID=A0A1D1WA59_RAMVA|nr:hypothetical protein RvY_17825-2 [Ramazzottius varieornatus]
MDLCIECQVLTSSPPRAMNARLLGESATTPSTFTASPVGLRLVRSALWTIVSGSSRSMDDRLGISAAFRRSAGEDLSLLLYAGARRKNTEMPFFSCWVAPFETSPTI